MLVAPVVGVVLSLVNRLAPIVGCSSPNALYAHCQATWPSGWVSLRGGVQVVALNGVGGSLDHCRYRHGAAGGGEVVWCCTLGGTVKTDGFLVRARRKPQRYPQVSRGFATQPWPKRRGFQSRTTCNTTRVVLRGAAAVAAARAVFTQQAAVFCVDVAVAQLFCVAGAGAPEFAEEVEDLLDEAGGFGLGLLVVVFFETSYCGPCRLIRPKAANSRTRTSSNAPIQYGSLVRAKAITWKDSIRV